MAIRDPACYRAALYIRLSKEDEQDGPSQSVQNQESLLREFVRQQGLQSVQTYIDDGWSGTNFERPGFQRMIADIEAKKINLVITKDLSRLGRDYILTGHYMERYFPEHRVRYISLLDGIDTGVDSAANDITPFRAIMNDMYAKDISKKIKSVKRDKQRQGLFIGGKPVYGYQMHPTEKNKIVVDEPAAAVVRRVFSLALSGMSCRGIATQLNREGVPPPAVYAHLAPVGAGLWRSERISEMLRNETYLGHMVQGRSVKVSYKSKKCLKQSPENWVVVEGTHEPLVDGETFQKVGQLLASRRHTRSRTYDFLLKGLIFCHECGRPLGVLNRRNAAGEDVLYFVCRTYQRFTKAGGCTSHTVREQTVTQAVTEKVEALCRRQLDPAALHLLARQMADQDRTDPLTELTACRSRLDRLTAALDRTYADRLSGLLSEEDFIRIYQRFQRQRRALEEQMSHPVQPAPQETIEEYAQKRTEAFLTTLSTNREVLVSLIKRVELTKEKEILVQFRFRAPEAIF